MDVKGKVVFFSEIDTIEEKTHQNLYSIKIFYRETREITAEAQNKIWMRRIFALPFGCIR